MKAFSNSVASAVILSGLLAQVPAKAAGKDLENGTLGVYLENDLFAGTDRYYTSGFKLSWSSVDLEKLSDSPYSRLFLPLFDLLPYVNETAYQKNLVFTLGQNIYTPRDTSATQLIPDDRPYAGWLYFGTGVVWKNASQRNSLVLNLGAVGSYSGAEQTQRFVHDLRGLDHPRGWNNQLHNELGAVLVYEHVWRAPRYTSRSGLAWEALPHAGAAVGNVKTNASLGAEVRLGVNLPDDFGTASISPVTTTSTPVEGTQAAQRSRFDLGAYLFARGDGRLVGHNIFLDGSTFGDSPSVGHKPLVADLSAGVAINYRNTKFAYALVYRTKEFSAQQDAQVFGTVSVNWAF